MPSDNPQNDTGARSRLINILMALALFCTACAYVLYGSPWWNPPPALTFGEQLQQMQQQQGQQQQGH